ncbi:hypothetical protein CAPTEDRAFT_208842, partial [Capitella teleta]
MQHFFTQREAMIHEGCLILLLKKRTMKVRMSCLVACCTEKTCNHAEEPGNSNNCKLLDQSNKDSYAKECTDNGQCVMTNDYDTKEVNLGGEKCKTQGYLTPTSTTTKKTNEAKVTESQTTTTIIKFNEQTTTPELTPSPTESTEATTISPSQIASYQPETTTKEDDKTLTSSRNVSPSEKYPDQTETTTEVDDQPTTLSSTESPSERYADQSEATTEVDDQPTTLSSTKSPPELYTDQSETTTEVDDQPTTLSSTESPPEKYADKYKSETSAGVGDQSTTSSKAELSTETENDISKAPTGANHQPATSSIAKLTENQPGDLKDVSENIPSMLPTESTMLLASIAATTAGQPMAQTDELTLKWETWTNWTVCHLGSDGSFQRTRIKLCSVVGHEETHNTTCNRILKGEISNQTIALLYGVHTEVCIPDVDGQWGEWTTWSRCSASCGQGTKSRTRQCVRQMGNGRACADSSNLQHELCQNEECSSE